MGAVPRALEWDRQPHGVVSPADGYGVTGLWLPGQSNRDAASGLALTGTSGTINREVGSFGPALGLRASNSSIYGTALAQHKPATAASIVWVGNLYAGVSIAACLGGVTYDNANSVPYVSYELKRSTGSGLNDLFLTWGSSGAFATLISSTAYGTGPVVIVGVVTNGYQRLYIRSAAGLEVLSAAGAITALDSSATARVEVGDSLNARTPDASCAMMALAGVAWSDPLARWVVENQWQLFAPEQVNVPMAGGGGSAALAGDANTGATATGSLSTAIPILGAAVSGATASGSLSTAISLAGATATISASAAGNLSATIRLAGDAVAAALASGGLSTGIPLAGGGSVGGAGTGDLSTGSGLAGAGAAGAAGTGILTTQITLSGAAIAQAIASGALTTTPAGLAGDGTSSSSGSGALSTAIPLAGAAAVSVVGAGGLVTAIALAGAATAAVSATGDLVVSLGLAGAALISAIGSGALLASITLNGAAVTGAVGAGALSGAALHASPWRTVTSLARVRSVRATARVRRCIAGVR